MEIIKKDIVDAAGTIVTEAGIGFLTTEGLATKMGIDYKILYNYFKSDADIMVFLLINLNHEIKTLVNEAESNNMSPEVELKLLFENVFNFFIKKPYYLAIVLSLEQDKTGDSTRKILINIETVIRNYLLDIIDKGKKEEIFKTKRTPATLANTILRSFRSLMNQENLMNKMVRDFRRVREDPDAFGEQVS